jgi:hypothetical protein
MGDIGSEFDSIFRHMTTHKIIVCRTCKFAVVPGQIERHLREHHPHVEKEKRNRVVKIGAGLESVAHTQEEVLYPQPTDEPVEGLPVHEGYGEVDRGRGRGGYRIDESMQRDEIVSPGSIRGMQAGDNG